MWHRRKFRHIFPIDSNNHLDSETLDFRDLAVPHAPGYSLATMISRRNSTQRQIVPRSCSSWQWSSAVLVLSGISSSSTTPSSIPYGHHGACRPDRKRRFLLAGVLHAREPREGGRGSFPGIGGGVGAGNHFGRSGEFRERLGKISSSTGEEVSKSDRSSSSSTRRQVWGSARTNTRRTWPPPWRKWRRPWRTWLSEHRR